MKYRLRITSEAADRLFAIAKWYAETSLSLELATTWYDGFLDELEKLSQEPLRGSLAAESHLFDFELRELYYGEREADYAPRALPYCRGYDRSAYDPSPCGAAIEIGRSLNAAAACCRRLDRLFCEMNTSR